MILKRKITTIIVIGCVMWICLFSLTFCLKRICIKTISENYMNTVVTNQIIDFVIDNYTGLTNEQLKSLQRDIVHSDSLYHFNELIFDEIVYHSVSDDFEIDQKIIHQFSQSCIELIENNLKTHLSNKQEEHIQDMIKEDLLMNRFSKNMNQQLQKAPFFKILYGFCDSVKCKVLIFIIILCHILYLIKKNRQFIWFDLFLIFLLSSLMNYLFLLFIHIATPVLAHLLNMQSLTIVCQDVLYCAMILLTGSLLSLFYMYKKSYSE